MLLEKPGGAVPGQFGRHAIVHRLPLLVDEGVFGVIAKKLERLPARLHGLLEAVDQLRRAPVFLAGEMLLKWNFHTPRCCCLLRRNTVEYHALGQLATFSSTAACTPTASPPPSPTSL